MVGQSTFRTSDPSRMKHIVTRETMRTLWVQTHHSFIQGFTAGLLFLNMCHMSCMEFNNNYSSSVSVCVAVLFPFISLFPLALLQEPYGTTVLSPCLSVCPNQPSELNEENLCVNVCVCSWSLEPCCKYMSSN